MPLGGGFGKGRDIDLKSDTMSCVYWGGIGVYLERLEFLCPLPSHFIVCSTGDRREGAPHIMEKGMLAVFF